MIDLCNGHHYWIAAIVLVVWQSFEAWLGWTDKVKSGSTPELLVRISIAAMFAVITYSWKGKIK